MTKESPEPTSRRSFMKIAAQYVAGGVCLGALAEIGKDAYGYIKSGGLTPGLPLEDRDQSISDLLFLGDPKATAIVPPGTNRHLLAKGILKPSRYLAAAFDAATGAHKGFAGLRHDAVLDQANPQLTLAKHKNLLLLGGPVASDLTKYLCGYYDSAALKDGKRVPIPRSDWPLPFYFHVGNSNGYGRWESQLRTGIRLLENGREELVPLYGVRIDGPGGNLIAPPMLGERVAGDMLMITRVPNPRSKSGTVTIIGGLHGHSIESFFSDIKSGSQLISALTNRYQEDYFQALIPYQLDSSGRAVVNLKLAGGWSPRVAKIDANQYLSKFGIASA